MNCYMKNKKQKCFETLVLRTSENCAQVVNKKPSETQKLWEKSSESLSFLIFLLQVVFVLKVMSSEMDPAKIRLIR